MSTLSVAKKDFKDARRAKIVWAVPAFFTLLASVIVYTYHRESAAAEAGVQTASDATVVKMALIAVAQFGTIFLPIVALVATYLAIAGERESGSIKYLLSLPNSRRDVILGKLLSRLGLTLVAVTLAFLSATIIGVYRFGAVSIEGLVGALGLTLLFVAAFVSLSIGFSAATASRSRSMAAAIGVYFVTIVMYVFPLIRIAGLVRYVHHDLLGMSPNPDLYSFVKALSPMVALFRSLDLIRDIPHGAIMWFEGSMKVHAETTMRARGGGVGIPTSAEANLPFYLQEWFALVVLVVWFVVPLALGYWQFQRTDLG